MKLINLFEPYNDQLVETVTDEMMHGEYIRANPRLFESTEEFKNSIDFVKQYQQIPTIGKKYIYSSVMITGVINNFKIATFSKPRKLVDIRDGYAYFDFDGTVRRFPENDKDANDSFLVRLFFDNNNEYNKFKTALSLKFDNQYTMSQKIIESNSITEEQQILEKDMSPSTLSKEVQQLIKGGKMPMIGVEIECCIPREDFQEYDPEADPNVPNIDEETTLDDLKSFFDQNSHDDWDYFAQEYDQWVWDKVSDYQYDEVEKTKNRPELYDGVKKRYMQEEVDSDDYKELLLKIEDDGEFTNEAVEYILQDAQKATKTIGPPGTWAYEDETGFKINHPGANLYLEIFLEDGEFDHYMYNFLSEQAEEEFRDWYEEFPVGIMLTENSGSGFSYDTMYDFFMDNTEWLYWPLGSLGNDGFDTDLAHQIRNAIEGISEYEVEVVESGYHGGSGRGTRWLIEDDSSIETNDETDTGFEIVSPAMPYNKAEVEIREVFETLVEKFEAYTNHSTGLHVNVSVQGIDHNNVNYGKLIVMLGDRYVLDMFNRGGNSFAPSALKQLAFKLREMANNKDAITGQPKIAPFVQMFDKIREKINYNIKDTLTHTMDFGKYTSVGMKDNRIEFRSPGGDDYLNNWGELEQTINRFVSSYAIAADPEAYKKEYAKKLYQVLSSSTDTEDSDHRLTTDMMKLFALYSSEKLTKEGLINGLRQIQSIRDEARTAKIKQQQKNEYDRASEELRHWIARETGKPVQTVYPMYNFAIRTERGKLMKSPDAETKYKDTTDHQFKMDALANVRANMEQDIDYYKNLADQENNNNDTAELPSNAPDMSRLFNNAVHLIHQNYRAAGRGEEVSEQMIKPILYDGVRRERERGADEAQAIRQAFRSLSADINYYRDTGIENVAAGFS